MSELRPRSVNNDIAPCSAQSQHYRDATSILLKQTEDLGDSTKSMNSTSDLNNGLATTKQLGLAPATTVNPINESYRSKGDLASVERNDTQEQLRKREIHLSTAC